MNPQLASLATAVVRANAAQGRIVSVAESCTGGLVCAAITSVSGSSEVFEQGFITYSNEAKMSSLSVSSDLLDTFGAVSGAVAWAMAIGALAQSGADVALSITGIAGPTGGSEKKPVGTVIFGVARKGEDPEHHVTHKKLFAPDDGVDARQSIREQAAAYALELLMP